MNKAIILAAGFGSRLGSITQKTPKCLLPLAGRPMLQGVIERLLAVGVNEIVINTSHLAEQVESFVQSLSYPGVQLKTSYEHELLGTGGGIKQAYQYFSEAGEFYVHNADIHSSIDLQHLAQQHKISGAITSIACKKMFSPRHLVFNANDNLIGWVNTESGAKRLVQDGSTGEQSGHYLCVQVLSPAIMEYFEQYSGAFSLFDPYLNAVEAGAIIKAVWFDDILWHDIGTPETLAAARGE